MFSKKQGIEKNYYGYFFVAPFVIIFLIFGLYPIVNTFILSFTNANTMNRWQGKFIGFDNYKVLFQSKAFMGSVKTTWYIWLVNFIPQLGVALVLASILQSQQLNLKGTGFFKAAFYLPNLLMPVTVAAFFNAFFSLYGPSNQFLVQMGIIPKAYAFLNSSTWAPLIVAFIQWWMWFGQTAIVLVAGMTAISPSFYESAMIDGASSRKMFFSVTLPLLKPILVYVLVTSLVGGLQMFDIPFMLTEGGRGEPNGSTMTLNILMNMKRASSNGDIGAAASVSVAIFLISTFFSVIIFYFLQREKEN